MNPSLSQSTDPVPATSDSGRAIGVAQQQVESCAAEASTQSDFMRRIAALLAEAIGSSIVAIESSQWSSPMMLVNDDSLADRIDRVSIRDLLATAAVVPIACDIPLQIPDDQGNDKTRAIRVQLNETPSRSAVLLIYAAGANPSPNEQLIALRMLNDYSSAIRRTVDSLPQDDVVRGLTVAENQNALASALRARQSLTQFHRDLDLDATAYRIANESRRLLNCDRTTVLLPSGKKFKVRAMSGVAVVDSRSNSVKSIERLAAAAIVMSRPMILPSEDQLPPQIQAPLDDYLDETGVMTTILLPLYEPNHVKDEDEGSDAQIENPFDGQGDAVALMMLEYFSGAPPEAISPATTIIASEAMYSLRNATEHRNVFGLRLWKSVGKLTHSGKFPLIATGLAGCVALLIASLLIQVEHHVIATGSVEPTGQRQVFANVDGVVKTIHVIDGQKVAAGEALFQLENADLESRAESLSGEIQTDAKRLASVQMMRLSPSSEPAQADRLALEERQLQSELKNLRAQQQLVADQQEQLVVTSPIDGTVVGWQLDRRLSDRPVTRGSLLVRVVDHNGPWSLRLNIPDYESGPLLEARQENDRLPVKFAVATVPDASFAAELVSVATAARMNEAGEHVIDGNAEITAASEEITQKQTPQETANSDTVDRTASIGSAELDLSLAFDSQLDTFDPSNVRVGADVTARIACGKRSVMRSWFSDVFDFVDRNVMFYFR